MIRIKKSSYWIVFSALACVLLIVSFILPGRLTEYLTVDFISEIFETLSVRHLMLTNFSSLLLIPVIITLIAINRIFIANILTSIYIVFQFNIYLSIHRISKEPYLLLWFALGTVILGLLIKEIKVPYLLNWIKITLIVLFMLFFGMNIIPIFLDPQITGFIGQYLLFITIITLFNLDRELKPKVYWMIFIGLVIFAFYLQIMENECHVEYITDMGLQNYDPLFIITDCLPYNLWLTIGFILHLSAKSKAKV
jgi:hypothetical protein